MKIEKWKDLQIVSSKTGQNWIADAIGYLEGDHGACTE
jgi:hypothetical protein